MEMYDAGKEYWTIVKRFNAHRTVPLMKKVAINDMRAALARTKNPAVRSRILAFLARNQTQSPGGFDGNGGPPRYA